MTRRTALRPLLLATLLITGCTTHPAAPSALPQERAQDAPPTNSFPQPDPAHPLTGAYTLTLSLGAACSAIPEADRVRQYSAVIEYRRAMNDYVVTLDGSFLSGPICTAGSGRFSGIGCNQFFAFEDIDHMWFWLANNNDEAHGGHLVERLSSGAWMEVLAASVVGPLTASPTIEAVGPADVWYCPTPSGYPFPCPAFTSCSQVDLRLKVTRRNL